MRAVLIAATIAALGPCRTAVAQEPNPDCPSLAVAAGFVAVQAHSLRANPERGSYSSAPVLALQNANWARKAALVFDALERQAASEAGRGAFSKAKASLSMLSGEPIASPGRASPAQACAVGPNAGPRTLDRQLDGLLRAERGLLEAWAEACGGR